MCKSNYVKVSELEKSEILTNAIGFFYSLNMILSIMTEAKLDMVLITSLIERILLKNR